MSKLADARDLNICLAWREHILSMLSDSDLRYVKHYVNLRLTANNNSVRKLNLQIYYAHTEIFLL